MNKHTAGPWRLHQDVIRIFAETGLVATAEPFGALTGAERDANARLVAAAPELLAACREALAFIRDEIGIEESFPNLIAAIAKAEGQADGEE